MPGRLSDSQVSFFHDQGYLILNDVFDRRDLLPLCDEIAARVDAIIEDLAAQGKLTNKHEGASFERRAALIDADHPENGSAIIQALQGKSGGGHFGIEMFRVISHPKLLDVVESLVGPEIVGSSVYRIRPKPPGATRGVVPWHQDSGYFAPQCDGHLVLTVWVPLVDANAHNGCMVVLPKAHRRGVVTHHTGGNAGFLVIEDQDLPVPPEDAVVAEVPMGGAVLMTNLTPHASTPNYSDIIRWSVDLRYQGIDVPNNLEVAPKLMAGVEPSREEITVACYPPEADFVVRSRKHPQRVSDYEDFMRRRAAFEESRSLPYPDRGWTPVAGR